MFIHVLICLAGLEWTPGTFEWFRLWLLHVFFMENSTMTIKVTFVSARNVQERLTFIVFTQEKSEISGLLLLLLFCYFSPGCEKHPGAQYCPECQESFVCEQKTGPTKGAGGTMGSAEPRPIAADEFCVLGNLLKVQNCLLSG